jgi:isopropylmalate/homocitrate/citramalate synthase
MAVANELAGISAGASCVHSCINGLGERTGNAPLEQLMVSMKLLLALPNDYCIEKLPYVCQEVAEITGMPIPKNMPIVGSRNYTRESGIGVDLVAKTPLAMFAMAPSLFGKTGQIVIGKKSGKASVKYFLEKLNLHASVEEIEQILVRIKEEGIKKKRLLTDDEFCEIHRQIVK